MIVPPGFLSGPMSPERVYFTGTSENVKGASSLA